MHDAILVTVSHALRVILGHTITTDLLVPFTDLKLWSRQLCCLKRIDVVIADSATPKTDLTLLQTLRLIVAALPEPQK